MANYNYGSGSPALDRSNFINDIYKPMDEFNRISFDYGQNPELAYELFLRSMMPSLSNTQEKTLRSAYGSILNDFLGQREIRAPGETPFRWVDYLASFDPNRELMRLDPSARYENPGRFTGRARWVAF